MGIERTNDWLEESLYDVGKIEDEIMKVLNSKDENLLASIRRHGMYWPNKKIERAFNQMKKKEIWETLNHYYEKYRREWNGPDVHIFLFPIAEKTFSLFGTSQSKSGLAYKEKLFMFVSGTTSDEELEALFVHEYHHSTRLSHAAVHTDNTLLGSIIMEGLAEHAVEEYCGKQYLAPWLKWYEEEKVEKLLTDIFLPNKMIKRSDKDHDRYLFGNGSIPKMAGYAAGYYLIKKHLQQKSETTKQMISKKPEYFL